MKNTKKAFLWIVNILQENNIPFQITGWLAAKIYGSNRELYDIDIEIPDEYFPILTPFIKMHLTYGPTRYIDKSFDLLLMSLNFLSQDIDISWTSSDKYFNNITQDWEFSNTNFKDSQLLECYWIVVPVIKLQDLIDYKSKIWRTTDLEDIKNIMKNTENNI